MNPRRSLLALGALGSAIALSGCVAAVIPLAAGMLMATSSRLDGGKATGSPAVAGLAPPAAAVAAVEPAEATLLAPAALAPAWRAMAQRGARRASGVQAPSKAGMRLWLPPPPPPSSSPLLVSLGAQ